MALEDLDLSDLPHQSTHQATAVDVDLADLPHQPSSGVLTTPRPVGLRDVFPYTTSLPPTLTPFALAGDVLNLPFRLVGGVMESARTAAETGRIPGVGETLRRSFIDPDRSREEQFFKTVGETLFAQPAFGMLGRVGGRLASGMATRVASSAEQSRILGAPAEDLIREATVSGESAARILRTLREGGQLEKFQQVFQGVRQGRVIPEAPRALPSPETVGGGFSRAPIDPDEIRAIHLQEQGLLQEPTEQEMSPTLPPGEQARLDQMAEEAKQIPQRLKETSELERLAALPPKPPLLSVRPLVRVRQQAIRAVTEELRTQSQSMREGSSRLRQRVLAAGGIRPRLAGGMQEELQAIRPFLRAGGRDIDDLATELGFESGEALREALMATRQTRMPSLLTLRQQATQIVDSEQGNRILEAIQAKGSSGKAITTVVQDVTHQMQRTLAQGQRQVRGILTQAQQQGMTPTQLRQFAAEQRTTPSETLTGPRGGTTPAPLTPEDIAQIQSRLPDVVPADLTPAQREALLQRLGDPERAFLGTGLPPPGRPPQFPRSTALVPRDIPPPGSLRDIPREQLSPLSGVDPDRLAEWVDQHPNGWVHRTFIETAIQADEREHLLIQSEFQSLSEYTKRAKAATGSDISSKLQRAAEGRVPLGTLTSEERAVVEYVRQRYDLLRERANAVLRAAGKPEIPYRRDYAPHFHEMSFLESVFGGLENVPDALLKTPFLRDILSTPVSKRAEAFRDIPETLLRQLRFLHPKTPFFRFALKRLGGPFTEDLIGGFNRYVRSVARLLEKTPAMQQLKPMLRYLPPKTQLYFQGWIDELAGRPAPLDQMGSMAPEILRGIQMLGRDQLLGVVLENFSIIFKQFDIMAMTLAHNGPLATLKGIARYADPSGAGRAFALQHATEVALRSRSRAFDQFSGQGRLALLGTQFVRMIDVMESSIAYLAGIENGKLQGITDWEMLNALGNRSVLRTHQTVRNLLRSNRMRSEMWRNTLGFLQGFTDNVTNKLFFDIGMMERTTKGNQAALLGALGFLLSVMAFREVYRRIGLPTGYGWTEFVPGPFRSVIQEEVERAFGRAPTTRFGQPAFITLALGLPLDLAALAQNPKDGRRAANVYRDLSRLASSYIPGGTQIRKTFEGLRAVERGGSYTAKGQARFPVHGFWEDARALLFGPYQTKAGQAYIERGFKPERSKKARLVPVRSG